MRRELNLIRSVLMSNFCRLASPYKVTFVLTYRCNLKCKICNIWKNPSRDELEIIEIEKIFKSIKDLSWLDLTGGEITLKEDLVDIVRVIMRSAPDLLIFHASTNGQRPESVELMVKEVVQARRLPVINISVDGPRGLNDELRGVKGAFSRSLETFRRLKKLSPHGHYYLSCTISNQNIHHVDELLAELKACIPDFTYSDIHFNLFHSSSHYYKNNEIDGAGAIDPAMVMKYLSLAKQGQLLKVFLENQYLKGMRKFLSGNKFPVACQALNATCFIDPDGRVYSCGIYDRPIGELRDVSFDMDQLWNQKEARMVRGNILKRQCPGCWSPCEAYPAILGSLQNRCS